MAESWYERFRATNLARCETGFGHRFRGDDNHLDDWQTNDWITAVVGELGELANLCKKYRRGEFIEQAEIEAEWADTFTYLDLLARSLRIDPQKAVAAKFDRVSDRIGWNGPRLSEQAEV